MDVKFQTGSKRFNYRAAGILIEQDHVLLHKQVERSTGHCLEEESSSVNRQETRSSGK